MYRDEQHIREEKPISVMYDVFDVAMPYIAKETTRCSKRKRHHTELLELNPNIKYNFSLK